MVRRTPPEIEEQIILSYNEGMKQKDLIKLYKISGSTIDNILKRNSDTVVFKRNINTPLIRFLKSFKDEGREKCFLWIKKKFRNGYGAFEVKAKYYLAHRVMYEFFYGYKPLRHEVVMHKCDNPSCVNPFHLELGTQKANIHDMLQKGRGAHGTRAGSAVLCDDQVIEIRKSNLTHEALAKIYNTTSSNIGRIKNYQTWKHL